VPVPCSPRRQSFGTIRTLARMSKSQRRSVREVGSAPLIAPGARARIDPNARDRRYKQPTIAQGAEEFPQKIDAAYQEEGRSRRSVGSARRTPETIRAWPAVKLRLW
jgi:hypothetical protein